MQKEKERELMPLQEDGTSTHALPVIAIVGRPNVGKSTLFNRLIGQRKAITHHTPGVTRDVIEEPCIIEGREMIVQDTGGIELEETEWMQEEVAMRALQSAKEAAVIMIVFDVHGLTGQDLELIERLRPYSDRLICAVNKVDNEKCEQLVWDFFQTGITDIVSISAEHGKNIDALRRMIVQKAAKKIDIASMPMSAPLPRKRSRIHSQEIAIAIVGRPNSGKSTLLNRLTKKDLSLVSEVPGTTRDVVRARCTIGEESYSMLDTAGIRRRTKEPIEFYSYRRAAMAIEESDIVLLMIDATVGLTEQDKKIASLVIEQGRGLILVLNKKDLVDAVAQVEDRLRFRFPILAFAPIVAISAQQDTDFKNLGACIERLQVQLRTRVGTGILNRCLHAWVTRYHPPLYERRRPKLRYITQVSAAPVHFILFVNRRQAIPASYCSYLVTRIRKELGFPEIPIRFEVRERMTTP